jgi:hypothetical protein
MRQRFRRARPMTILAFPRRLTLPAAAALTAFLLAPAPCAHASDTACAPARFVAGSTLDSLTVGKVTYTQVRIRTISAQTAIIQHAGGIASLRLRDLPPELQQRFGYSPEAAAAEAEKQKATELAARERRLQEAADLKKRAAAMPRPPATSNADSKIDQLLRGFGEPATIQPKVDLRPRFNELGLWIKQQGLRPSCSVFAIVSALEFQSAELTGTATRFSEEYLLWATRKTLNRAPRATPDEDAAPENLVSADEGFSLPEVVTALRTYGIPPRESMPNRFTDNSAGDPPAEVIERARKSRRVSIHQLPGRDGPARVESLVHALNAGLPVPAGLAWPIEYNWRTGHLDKHATHEDRGHAVTFVGYKSDTGRIEDAVFTFKNSWGVRWGINGYGSATYEYLSKNLWSSVVLEVLPQ